MIGNGLSGETGENPVRARRRKASVKHLESDPKPHAGTSHWNPSEKAVLRHAKSKYPVRPLLFYSRERRP